MRVPVRVFFLTASLDRASETFPVFRLGASQTFSFSEKRSASGDLEGRCKLENFGRSRDRDARYL